VAINPKLLNEGENVVISTRTHPKALVAPLLALIVLLAIAAFVQRVGSGGSGLIAKEGRTIPLNRISGVDFEIGVIDRIFGCGTLVVTDASEHGQVLLHDIPRVEQVQKIVSGELDRQAGHHHRSDDGT
jgi:uncharacterized membrane protein YdbT with pleckstrin-like domain